MKVSKLMYSDKQLHLEDCIALAARDGRKDAEREAEKSRCIILDAADGAKWDADQVMRIFEHGIALGRRMEGHI